MKLTAALLSAICTIANADNFAVLVAGSNTFSNYRHQADVFHAYQILTANGYTDDHIIMMAYDDIATARSNPFQGQVFNAPTDEGTPGVDVYPGTDAIDYVGDDVTAENFMKVLTGDSSAPGPVLQTTSDDKVFVNFVDHGGAGLIAFPTGAYLYADDLITTLTTMSDNNMYSELVFYMEACESGSMFEGLDIPANIYATTAANAEEPSWGTYCSPDDKVDGTSIGSCLGDLYSVNWMSDSDVPKNMRSETLDEQYQAVVELTTKSHVMQYGDDSMGSEKINEYQAYSASNLRRGGATEADVRHGNLVDSRDNYLQYLINKYTSATEEDHDEILALIAEETASRENIDEVFENIVAKVSPSDSSALTSHAPRVTQHACQKQSVEAYTATCGRFTDYGLKKVAVLVNLCESGVDTQHLVMAVNEACA